MNPIVVFYGNDAARCQPLRASLQKWGWAYRHVGFTEHWKGFGNKLKVVTQAMADLAKWEKPFTHALSVDGYDTLAVGPPSELEAAFANYGNPGLLYAAEAACWPTNIDAGLYPEEVERFGGVVKLGRWRFPHSPFAVDLSRLDLLDVSGVGDEEDDQAFAHKNYALGTRPDVKLDERCRWMMSIAHCGPWDQYFEIDGDRVRNKATGNLGLFCHGNGTTEMGWIPGAKS